MAEPAKNRAEKWCTDAEIQNVRFDNPKSQDCGCAFGTIHPTQSNLRWPSCHRQDDDSIARSHRNEQQNLFRDRFQRSSTEQNFLGDRFDRINAEQNFLGDRLERKNSERNFLGDRLERSNVVNGAKGVRKDECMDIAEALRRQLDRMPGDLRQKERPECLAGDLRRKEKCFDIPRAHRKEKKCTAGDLRDSEYNGCSDGHCFWKEKRENSSRKERWSESLPNEECIDSFRKEKCINSFPNEECIDSLRKDKCIDSFPKEECIDSLRKEKCIDSFPKEECMDSFGKEECTDSSRKERWIGSLRKEECIASFRKEECNDSSRRKECNDSYRKQQCNDSLRKEECIDQVRERLFQFSENRNTISGNPFTVLRKAWTDVGGSPESIEQSSSRFRGNADPAQNSHSKSSSQSSSRCVTPHPLKKYHYCTFPSPQNQSLHSSASRSTDSAPGKHLRSNSEKRTKYFLPSTPYNPPQSRSTHRPFTKAVQYGMKFPGPRRKTLIERYQQGLTKRKYSSGIKASKNVCSRSPWGAPPPSSMRRNKKDQDHFFLHHENGRLGKSDEGLCPLRCPELEISETSLSENPRCLLPCCEQLHPIHQRRSNYRHPEYCNVPDAAQKSLNRSGKSHTLQNPLQYDPSYHHPRDVATRGSSRYGISPDKLQESFEYDDSSHGNSHPPQFARQSSNYCDTAHPLRGSCNCQTRQKDRSYSKSTEPPHAVRDLSSSCDDPQAAREASVPDFHQTAETSSCKSKRPRQSERNLSSANGDPHVGRESRRGNNSQGTREFVAPFDGNVRDSRLQDDSHPARQAFHPHSARAVIDDPHTPKYPWWHHHAGATRDVWSSSHNCQRDAWWRKDGDAERGVASSSGELHTVRDSCRHSDPGLGKQVASPFDDPLTATDSRRRNDLDAAREVARTARDSWQHKVASPFDDPHRNVWMHNGSQLGRPATTPFDDLHTAKDTLRHNHPDAAREFSSYDDLPRRAIRETLRNDNMSPRKLSCCPQQYDMPTPSSRRCYGQLQSCKSCRTQNGRRQGDRKHCDGCPEVAARHH